MADAEQLLWRVAGGEAERGGFHWGQIAHAMHQVSTAPPPEDPSELERLLHALLEVEGPLPLRDDSPLPHAMAPERMVQAFALQVLAKLDLDKHRHRIEAVASSERTPSALAAVARMLLASDGPREKNR